MEKKERIAATFRAFSRGDEVSPPERNAALFWLRRLAGFSKTEADAFLFVAECIVGHAKLFAKVVKDSQVLFIVEKRFRSYMDGRDSKRRRELVPIVALDIEKRERLIARQHNRPLSTRHEDAAKGVEEMDWKSLNHATQAEQDDDMRATKASDFAQFLQALKDRGDKESELYLHLIHETLTANKYRSRSDARLERALRIQAMAKNPRIRSLTYRRTRAK